MAASDASIDFFLFDSNEWVGPPDGTTSKQSVPLDESMVESLLNRGAARDIESITSCFPGSPVLRMGLRVPVPPKRFTRLPSDEIVTGPPRGSSGSDRVCDLGDADPTLLALATASERTLESSPMETLGEGSSIEPIPAEEDACGSRGLPAAESPSDIPGGGSRAPLRTGGRGLAAKV
eukprot:CAMPEP_0206212556 /NCGR_PEP_ID=MMETSP0047_2-20121206/636_1 /ASSEMBLY_ACC=CAM_ASM_000192 /TAXON_ID=195065 /ORGANISM="Chroomonas mesostigmatica_cf, Strain CCMP1168" /LENGTH=177 /DNA_ID=CAMNT_0053634615 /DNA_START=141 /DNA_END=671 /DNA_ORIENTATION=-